MRGSQTAKVSASMQFWQGRRENAWRMMNFVRATQKIATITNDDVNSTWWALQMIHYCLELNGMRNPHEKGLKTSPPTNPLLSSSSFPSVTMDSKANRLLPPAHRTSKTFLWFSSILRWCGGVGQCGTFGSERADKSWHFVVSQSMGFTDYYLENPTNKPNVQNWPTKIPFECTSSVWVGIFSALQSLSLVNRLSERTWSEFFQSDSWV